MSAAAQAGGATVEEGSDPAAGSPPDAGGADLGGADPGGAPAALRRFPSSPGSTPAPAASPVSGPRAEPAQPTSTPGPAPTAGGTAGAVRGTRHEPAGGAADSSGPRPATIGMADPATIGAAPGSVLRRSIGGPGLGRERSRLGRWRGEPDRWAGGLTGARTEFGGASTGLHTSRLRVGEPWALSTVGRVYQPSALTTGLRRAFDSGAAGTEPFAARGVARRWRSTVIVPAGSTLRPAPGLVPMRPLTTPVADRLEPERGRAGSSAAVSRTGSGSAASTDRTRMTPLRRYGRTGAAGHRTVEGVLGTGTTASTPAWAGAVGGGRRPGPAMITTLSRTTPSRTGPAARAGVNPTAGTRADPPAGAGRASGAPAPVDRSPAALAGLPAAISGLPSLRRTPADISAARSAATASVGRLAWTSSGVGRHSGALIRRRRAEAIGAAGAIGAIGAASSRPAITGQHAVTRPATSGDAAHTGIDRHVASARRSPVATGPVDRRTGHAPATATGWTVPTRWMVSAGWTAPAGHGGPTRWDMPTSIRRLIPDDRAAYRLPSIGSARTITPARTAAAGGRAMSNAGDRVAAGIRRITPEAASQRLVPSARTAGADPVVGDRRTAATPPWANGVGGPATPAEPSGSRGTRGVRRSAASERRVTVQRVTVRRVTDRPPVTVPPEHASQPRTASGEPAGLLLRQAIPPTAVVAAATFSTIRRMPPSPPRGTPRLGSHRLTTPGDRRGPDVPASADPSWSFAAAATVGESGQRGRTGPTIGARTRGSRSITLPLAGLGGTATGWPATGDAARPDTAGSDTARSDTARSDAALSDAADRRLDPASARRPSLLDLVPPSLFDRARAGLAAAGGVPSTDVDQFAVRPPGIAAANPEGAYVNGSTDDLPAQRQRIAEALTPREWDELVDVIVDRLEDRILDELARRGRRFTPGVF